MQKNSFKFGKTKTQVFVGLCMFGVKEIFRTIHVYLKYNVATW